MSATLTWFHSALQAKTGTTNAALITDMESNVNSKLGDANFKWQVASSNIVGTPLYLVLKPKDGSAGRILFLIYTGGPANYNPALWLGNSAINNNAMYCFYFPAGNVDTPSNLTAASGAVMGVDTGATGFGTAQAVSSLYATNVQVFYFDSAEAVIFGFFHPTSGAASYMCGAGMLVVDASDNAYAAVISSGNSGVVGSFGSASSSVWPHDRTSADTPSGANMIRVYYGGVARPYYFPWSPTGSWANVAVSATDILTDTANSKVWFVPALLLGRTKGEGFILKLRQIAFGPGTTSDFTVYNASGPLLKATQFNSQAAGVTGTPWILNFKL